MKNSQKCKFKGENTPKIGSSYLPRKKWGNYAFLGNSEILGIGSGNSAFVISLC